MSGIAGIYHTDGLPIEAAQMERMLDVMAHRGPDGRNQWLEGFIGLGHCMLHVTPESLNEHLPLELDGMTISADARIDNREILFAALAIPHDRRAEMGDSELILRAYQRWGADCVTHLIGDFAFAIWDAKEKRLFCGRDHFGLKPFYYYHSANRFIFATEVRAIFSALPVMPAVREETIVDRLIQNYTDKTSTYFEDIYRLPPAHFLMVKADGSTSLQEYWRLDPERELVLNSFEDYADQFRELFIEAVRCRMRSAFPVGAMLSGGLDSSSVACVARNLLGESDPNPQPLHAFLAITPDVSASDERQYQEMILASGGFQPHFFRVDQVGPLYGLESRLKHLAQPILGPNSFIDWMAREIAEQNGVRVILDGFDGDTVVSHGDAIFREWTVKRDWSAMRQEIKYVADITNLSEERVRSPMFMTYVIPTLQTLVNRGERVGVLQRLLEMARYFDYPRRAFVKDGLRVFFPQAVDRVRYARLNREPPMSLSGMFTPDAAQRYDLTHRRIPLNPTSDALSSRDYHYRRLINATITHVIEDTAATSAAFHLEVRSPFFDIRLVEFCLAAPSSYKMYHGYQRALLRQAMRGIVPDGVRMRLSKANYAVNFSRMLIRFERDKIELATKNIRDQMPYIDAAALERATATSLQNEYLRDEEFYLWQIISTALWLNHENYVRSS